MKKIIVSSFLVTALLFACSLAFSQTSLSADISNLSKSINRFAFDLYGELAKAEKGNIFFSPQSISTALAMVYAGAVDETKDEMQRVMYYGNNVHPEMKAFLDMINATPKSAGILEGANAVWPSVDYDLLPEYQELVSKYYGAKITKLDYRKKTQEAIKAINSWADKKTRGRIKQIVNANSVRADTTAVLTNAIYFRSQWDIAFKKENTKKEDFFVTPKNVQKVDMMMRKDFIAYAETKDVQAVSLPYKDNLYSMLIILPKDKTGKNGIDALDKAPLMPIFDEVRDKLFGEEVILSMPKFKVETSYESMEDYLQKLGMRRVFSDAAQISKMAHSPRPFKIDRVIHKAFCAVDERETEAAAVTAITMSKTSLAPSEPKVFRADHPFLYFIMDNRTDTILFMGRFMGQ